MKGLLLALDGLFNAFRWGSSISAVVVLGFLWWSGEVGGWNPVFIYAATLVILAILGVLFRIATHTIRTKVLRMNLIASWKDGILTEEQRNDVSRWQSGMYKYIFFGIDPNE